MTPGLRGKVLVVDPKWNFVVLDIGETNGVVQNGVMMISRNSKLVAKVRIMNLEAGRSIANIMPGWKLGEVMEGDQALY
jgi:ribosomal protein L24